jgi:hypothetical protein
VNVVDTTAPVIELNGDANLTHVAGAPYMDAHASWSDAVDGNGTLDPVGDVNSSMPGIYILTYDLNDSSGNAAKAIFRQVEVINFAPSDLYISGDGNLTILENEPNATRIGTLVGVDQNPNSVLSFSLIHVFDEMDARASHLEYNDTLENQFLDVFELSREGLLSSTRSLDYEVDPQRIGVLVRVTDQYGKHLEKTFFVSVLNVIEDFDQDGVEDAFDPDDDGDGFNDILESEHDFNPLDRWNYPELPIVKTLQAVEENGSLVFEVEILSQGGFKEMDAGILIFDDQGTLIQEINRSATSAIPVSFSLSMEGFHPGQQIRYQAFAVNLVGRSDGQVLEYRVDGAGGVWWEEDQNLEGNWRESSWFGVYLPNHDNHWVYHLRLGWLYTHSDEEQGLWLWMPEEKWVWTKAEVWPFLWSGSTSDWLYPI